VGQALALAAACLAETFRESTAPVASARFCLADKLEGNQSQGFEAIFSGKVAKGLA
jgi:hypothetical protein